MCNECAYCGDFLAPLRIDEDEQLTCKACAEDEDAFYGMTTLEEWQDDQREAVADRAIWMMRCHRDDMMEAR